MNIRKFIALMATVIAIALFPSTFQQVSTASGVKEASKTQHKVANEVESPAKRTAKVATIATAVAKFDPLKPSTWPKCAASEYVRADNGKCTKKPAGSPVVAQNAPISIGIDGNCQSYRPLFEKYNWNVSVAMAIMQAESSCVATKISPAYINWDHIPDYGLMQIHGVEILDPAQNISYAYYHKYLQSGWSPWTTYTSGKYLQYLQ